MAGTTCGVSSSCTRCVSVALRLVQRGGRIVERIRRVPRRHDVFVRRTGDGRCHPDSWRSGSVIVVLKSAVLGASGQVPAAPDHRVAARHQERVREHGGLVIEPGSLPPEHTPERGPRLAAAIRRLVHHLVRALAQVDRFQDVEVERVLDVAAGILRRELDVDDDGVLRIGRVDLAEGFAGDLLVLPDAGPRVTAKRRRLRRGDLNLGDSRIGDRRCPSVPVTASAPRIAT